MVGILSGALVTGWTGSVLGGAEVPLWGFAAAVAAVEQGS